MMHASSSTKNSPTTSRRPSFGEYFPISPQSRRNSSSNVSKAFALSNVEERAPTNDGKSIVCHASHSLETPRCSRRKLSHSHEIAAGEISLSTSAVESDDDDTVETEVFLK